MTFCSMINLAVLMLLTVTRHSSSLRQRLFRLSEPSPQRRLSSLSIRSYRKNIQHEWTWIIYFIPLFHLSGYFPHTPSSSAQLCRSPWACWWCRSQTQTCSSGELLEKVHRGSGKKGRGAFQEEWKMFHGIITVICSSAYELSGSVRSNECL